MADELAQYLHDHLAGAKFAVALLEDLRKQCPDPDIVGFCAALLIEVEADRSVLQGLVQQIAGGTNAAKEVAAWVAQKAGRFKLTLSEPMGTFEAIEALSLGVQGKLALWNALRAVRELDERLEGLDLDELRSRALQQFSQLEDVRLRLAQSVLATPCPQPGKH